jgi:hypothetical protein
MLHGLRDVLRDWAALDLIRPFLWVDEADVDPRQALPHVVATLITNTTAARVRLQDHLADRQDMGLVRLVPISTMGIESVRVSQRVAGYLYTSLDGVRAGQISPVHCILARHGMGGWEPEPAWAGWHTLVVAPEDAWTPATASTDLTYGHSDGEFYGHVAAAVSSLVGLWKGMGEAPFDVISAAAVSRPRVARAFMRRLDAAAVTTALRQALTDLSVGLPRPHFRHSPCEHLRAPDVAIAQTAQAVLDRHHGLLAIQRDRSALARSHQLGAPAALRMFASFMWAALRRAPWAAFDNVRSRASATVSRHLQHALFGDRDSRYEVVTAGVTAAGLPASADDLAHGAEEIARRVHTVIPGGEHAVADTASFWRDAIAGGLTLADGGTRTPDIPPVTVGGLPGVVADVGYVAPSPTAAFVLPAPIAAVMGIERVAPHDIRAQEQFADHLRATGTAAADIAGAAERFDAWRADVGKAYTSRLGQRLAWELRTRTAAVASLLHELRTAAPAEESEPATSDQQSVLLTLGMMVLGVMVIGFAVTASLVRGWLPASYAVALAVTLAVSWIGRLLYTLFRQQQRLFALLTSRNSLHERHATNGRDIANALSELHVAAVLYQQYLAWAPVLGSFLRAPFGDVPRTPVQPRLAGPLPRAMGLGVAYPNPQQIAAVTHALGATVYECGWLGSLWTHLIADAPHRLGTAGLGLHREPGLLLADEAMAPTTPLRLWADLIVRDGVSGASGDALWRRARETLLAGGVDALAGQLFGEIEVAGQAGHGVGGRLTGTTFLNQLTAVVSGAQPQYFSTSVFDAAAVSEEAHRVKSSVVVGGPGIVPLAETDTLACRWVPPATGEGTDLDQFVVVVQTTDPLPPERLSLQSPLVHASVGSTDRLHDSDPTFPDLGL